MGFTKATQIYKNRSLVGLKMKRQTFFDLFKKTSVLSTPTKPKKSRERIAFFVSRVDGSEKTDHEVKEKLQEFAYLDQGTLMEIAYHIIDDLKRFNAIKGAYFRISFNIYKSSVHRSSQENAKAGIKFMEEQGETLISEYDATQTTKLLKAYVVGLSFVNNLVQAEKLTNDLSIAIRPKNKQLWKLIEEIRKEI
jgi:hypothetical protein